MGCRDYAVALCQLALPVIPKRGHYPESLCAYAVQFAPESAGFEGRRGSGCALNPIEMLHCVVIDGKSRPSQQQATGNGLRFFGAVTSLLFLFTYFVCFFFS